MSAQSQTIFRVASRHKPYSQLGNAMIRDGRVSWEARAMLAYILSYPADWNFSLAWFCRETKTGRDRARNAVKELVEAGYCVRDRMRKNDGTLGPYEYVFTDEPGGPQPAPEKPSVVHVDEPAPEKSSSGQPVTGQPALVNPTPTKKVDQSKKVTKDRSSNFRGEDEGAPRPAPMPRFVSEQSLDQVRTLAPGWDRQFLLRKFTDWDGSRRADNIDAAFLGWVKAFTKCQRA